jgi:hypothetical protein
MAEDSGDRDHHHHQPAAAASGGAEVEGRSRERQALSWGRYRSRCRRPSLPPCSAVSPSSMRSPSSATGPPGSREVWIRTPPSLLPFHLSNSFALPRCNATLHVGAGPTGSQDLGCGFAWDKLDRGDGGMLSPSARPPLGMDSLLWRAQLCGC